MPKLPSGLHIALDDLLIPTDIRSLPTSPSGCFWTMEPNPEIIAKRPLSPNHVMTWRFSPAPLPKNPHELVRHIRILQTHNPRTAPFFWTGYFLSDFSAETFFNSTDASAWNRWLRSAKVTRWLTDVQRRCSELARLNAQYTSDLPLAVDIALADLELNCYRIVETDPRPGIHPQITAVRDCQIYHIAVRVSRAPEVPGLEPRAIDFLRELQHEEDIPWKLAAVQLPSESRTSTQREFRYQGLSEIDACFHGFGQPPR